MIFMRRKNGLNHVVRAAKEMYRGAPHAHLRITGNVLKYLVGRMVAKKRLAVQKADEAIEIEIHTVSLADVARRVRGEEPIHIKEMEDLFATQLEEFQKYRRVERRPKELAEITGAETRIRRFLELIGTKEKADINLGFILDLMKLHRKYAILFFGKNTYRAHEKVLQRIYGDALHSMGQDNIRRVATN